MMAAHDFQHVPGRAVDASPIAVADSLNHRSSIPEEVMNQGSGPLGFRVSCVLLEAAVEDAHDPKTANDAR